MDDVPPFVWTFPYVRERRDNSPAGYILRPVVPLRFVGPDGSRSDPYEALIDSGAENILTPEWVAWSLGLELDGEDPPIQIGGAVRSTRFCDVDIVTEGPDGDPIRWRTPVGFMAWPDPPWMVILGQGGFFDQFHRVHEPTRPDHRPAPLRSFRPDLRPAPPRRGALARPSDVRTNGESPGEWFAEWFGRTL